MSEEVPFAESVTRLCLAEQLLSPTTRKLESSTGVGLFHAAPARWN